MNPAKCLLVALAMFMALGGLSARVAESAPPAQAAKESFLAGKAHYKGGRFLEALHSFQQALAVVERPSIVIMVAHCYRQLDRPDLALTHYRRYLSGWRAANPGKPSPFKSVVEGHISHMKTIVDLVQRGEALLQEGNPASALPIFQAALQQNGWIRIHLGKALCLKQQGKQEQALEVIEQTRKRLREAGSRWKEKHPDAPLPELLEAEDAIRRLEKIRLAVAELQAAATRGKGQLYLVGLPPGARVSVDGVFQAEAPLKEPLKLSPGLRWVSVELGGYQPWEQKVSMSSGNTTRVEMTLERATSGRSLFWLVSGITTVALAVGSEAGAWGAFTEANNWYPHEAEYETYRNLSIAGHVVAGAFAVASGISFVMYYLSGAEQTPANNAQLMVVPVAGGTTITGRFRF